MCDIFYFLYVRVAQRDICIARVLFPLGIIYWPTYDALRLAWVYIQAIIFMDFFWSYLMEYLKILKFENSFYVLELFAYLTIFCLLYFEKGN